MGQTTDSRPHDVVIACVAENQPRWYRMLENLAISTRVYGGRLAAANMVAHIVGAVDEHAGRDLRALGVDLRVCQPYNRTSPPTNKLRLFEDFAARRPADFLLAMDCDTVIVRDFFDQADPERIRVVAARDSPLTNDQWVRALDTVGLRPADTPTVMLSSGQEVPAPYVNSGVMIVPVAVAEPLIRAWTKYVDELLAAGESGVDEPWAKGWFIDQIALTCALLDGGFAVQPMGPVYNLPTGVDLGPYRRQGPVADPAVLHYHRRITSSGMLERSPDPVVDRLVDGVNRVVAARVSRPQPTRQRRAARKLRRLLQPGS